VPGLGRLNACNSIADRCLTGRKGRVIGAHLLRQ
jgi:hypothetical protein